MRITSRELGDALRPGLGDLKAYFSGEGDNASEERVDRFLKGVRAGAHLAAQENNELLMLLKFGKASGAGPDEMKPVFQAIAGRYAANGGVVTRGREALGIEDSSISKRKAAGK